MIADCTLTIDNARIVTPDTIINGYVAVGADGKFIDVGSGPCPERLAASARQRIDADGRLLMPGVIDEHVHFRQPGMTHKGDIASESRAAVAGGVTSFIDMPNNIPATVTIDAIRNKKEIAAQVSPANYGFYIGATAENISAITAPDFPDDEIAGIKVFLGSSTGNLLLNNPFKLERLFERSRKLIAVHAEDEAMIQEARVRVIKRYGENPPVQAHTLLRSRAECFSASKTIVSMARRIGAACLHLLHVSTADELSLLTPGLNPKNKQVTAETCTQYLLLSEKDYPRLGARMKCNPSIKCESDRLALLNALNDGRIDTLATDHAPHLLSEKQGGALEAVSGMPGIQFSLPLMLSMGASAHEVARAMAFNPAIIYGISLRGFISRGYYADMVLLSNDHHNISDNDVISPCGWTPYDGHQAEWRVDVTWVNGTLAFDRHSGINQNCRGQNLKFER